MSGLGTNEWIAVATAIGAAAALLTALIALWATRRQLAEARIARDVDYYRQLTPFLSFELVHPQLSGAPLAVEVFAHGGGAIFNVIVSLIEAESTTGQNVQIAATAVIRHLRGGSHAAVSFSNYPGAGFQGYIDAVFVDGLGGFHHAKQWVNSATGKIETTDAVRWYCDSSCRVHHPPAPSIGRFRRSALVLRGRSRVS